MQCRFAATAILTIACTIMSHCALANRLILGIDWSTGIIVQEYWQDQSPKYMIANETGRPVSVSIEMYRKSSSALPIPVTVPVGAYDVAEAPAAIGGNLVDFKLGDDTSIGWMLGTGPPPVIPADPLEDSPVPDERNRVISTRTGLNGSTGSDPDIIVVQNQVAYTSGQTIHLSLVIRHFVGVLVIKQSAQPVHGLFRLMMATVSAPDLIVAKQDNGDDIITAASSTSTAPEQRIIQFTATAPKVTLPTFAALDFFYAKSSVSSEDITRGIWIKPTKPAT